MLTERIRSIRCPPEGEYAALQGKPRGPIRPLPERIGKGVGHAGSQPPRGCLYGAWVLPFTPIHRGQPQCLRQRHSRSPPRRQLGSPLLRHMPRLRPRRRFPQRLRKRDGDSQNRATPWPAVPLWLRGLGMCLRMDRKVHRVSDSLWTALSTIS